MYIPKHFEEKNKERITALANKYAFAALITINEGVPFANHLPLLIEEDDHVVIVGHMARANEQWKHFRNNHEVLAIFQGPHAYISPSNYEGTGVPTWNYTAIHFYGKCRIIEEERALKGIVESLTHKYEVSQKSPWVPDYPGRMLSAIVGFELLVDRVEAKYKLSQNRSAIDRKNIPASCINYPSQSVFAAQKVLFSGQNGVWLKFTPGEVKTHGKIACRMW